MTGSSGPSATRRRAGRGRAPIALFGRAALAAAVLAFATIAAAPANAASGEPELQRGEHLAPGQALVSDDGNQTLVMQADGDAVLFGPEGGRRWATGTSVRGSTLSVRADGDVAVLGPRGKVLWDSGTTDVGGAVLRLQDDGDLTVVDAAGTIAWDTDTGRAPSLLAGPAWLAPGDSLSSPDGRQNLYVLDTGDVVLQGPDGNVRWDTGTAVPGSTFGLLPDGNMVVRAPDGTYVWRARTAGTDGATIVLGDNGELRVYSAAGTEVWYSGTVVGPTRLHAPGTLAGTALLSSPDGRTSLRVDAGGHAVIAHDDGPVWRSARGVPGARLELTRDGDLRLVHAKDVLWRTGTTGTKHATLTMTDAAVRLLAPNGHELWRVDLPADVVADDVVAPASCDDVTGPVSEDKTVLTAAGIRVNPCLATQVDALVLAAHAAGVDLGGWGWRSTAQQVALRAAHCGSDGRCSPPTALPGHSMHERGLAIDFTVGGATIGRGSPAFVWLTEHAAHYGLHNLPSESWHWSTNGH